MKNRTARLPGFGPVTTGWLHTIGIRTLGQLEQIGPAEAYHALRSAGFPVSANFLYAAEGAIVGTPWNKLPESARKRLRREAGIPSPSRARIRRTQT